MKRETSIAAAIGALSVAILPMASAHEDAAELGEIPDPVPFGGKPHPIPGKIEAENYDEGPAGIAYEDKDVENQGAGCRGETRVDIEERDDASNGYGIGWTKAGEWLNYTVEVAEDGSYDIDIPVACEKQGGSSIWRSAAKASPAPSEYLTPADGPSSRPSPTKA